jgi:drug/metabolite transporter (DMT)-like permease
MSFSRSAAWGAAAALAAGTVFSFGGVPVRLSPHLDPFQYNLWRCVGLIPFVLLLSLIQRRSPIAQMREARWLGLAGGLCLTLAGTLFIAAMKTTTVANALLFASGAPLLGALLARVLLREAIDLVTWIGIGLGALGLLVMTGSELGAGNALGNAAAVGSALAYALYSIVVRIGRDRDMSGTVIDYAILIALVSALLIVVTGSSFSTPMAENAWAMVHGGLFIGGGMLLFNYAARTVKAGQLTLLAQTETVLGPLWVFLLFGETPRLTTVLGGALILLGVMLSAWGQTRRSAPMPVAPDVPDHRAQHDGAAEKGGQARIL